MKEKPTPTWTRTAIAKLAGVGAETLRFYGQKGLIGKLRRTGAGYRLYGVSDLERLRFIGRAQQLGFSLQDIKQLLQLAGDIKTSRRRVRDFAGARLEQIRGKIRDLQAMEQALGSLVAQCDGRGALKGCPIAEFIGNPDSNSTPQKHCHE